MVLGLTRPIITSASRTAATSVVARSHNVHALESVTPVPGHPSQHPAHPLPSAAPSSRSGYTYGNPIPRAPLSPRSQSPPPPATVALSPPSVTPSFAVNMVPDSKLLTTHKRHADFDPHLIASDSRFAGQFYRWKEWHRKNESMVKTKMVRPGDILAGSVKGAVLASTGAKEASFRPGMFKVQLLEEAESESSAMTYQCKLISVGDTVIPATGEPSSRSRLWVKMYDDRFFPGPSGGSWYQLGDKHRSAEDYVKSEVEAYRGVEGWKCHGAFRFVLSREGHWLHGILLEDMRPSALKA